MGKLTDKNVLREHVQSLYQNPPKGVDEWHRNLEAFLVETKGASKEKLLNREFLRSLFESTVISSTGNGSVKTAPALANDDFIEWFAKTASQALPPTYEKVEEHLKAFRIEAIERLQKLCGRRPRLKLNRAMCALYPQYLTTVADGGSLRALCREMGGKHREDIVHINMDIRRRIDDVLGGPALNDLDEIRRMCLPWLLVSTVISEDDVVDLIDLLNPVTENELRPLPATQRRKGLTAMKGNFQALLGYLPELDGDGLTHDELMDVVRQANPGVADNTVRTYANIVSREFGLCQRNGNIYQLSPRGSNLYESQDPQDLADLLLTRVLGVDHVIRDLAQTVRSKVELTTLLQKVNPGWTSPFAPNSLLKWLTSLDVIAVSEGEFRLTESGRRWNEMISWEPQFLPNIVDTIVEVQAVAAGKFELPDWDTLRSNFLASTEGKFKWNDTLIEQLHAGLWSHPVRHFAIMAGLSGSGKTQLALNYAIALCSKSPLANQSVKVIPVQPGWFDTSSLLGYAHPLQINTYIGTPFLDLLLKAAENPHVPYVAILDEMNLSHPEQYLAPILSAMETHGSIELHQLDEDSCGVPSQIQYPANLALIGTVNMDETTHGLSDKVLDRAFTLEFWDIDVERYPKWHSLPSNEVRVLVKNVLQLLMSELAPVRLHFGWRTIDDIVGYLTFTNEIGVSNERALDDVLFAKVLPKLRAESSDRYIKVLSNLGEIFRQNSLNRCDAKVTAMLDDLHESGSARFWR